MKPRFFSSPAQLGRWLARHHASTRELQVGFYKKASGRWVMSAKQEETRQRRLDVLIAHAAKARRIPPLAPTTPRR